MLYKYCTTEGFDILLKARLKAAKIENFNDPFELVFGVDEETAIDNIRKEYENNKEIISHWQNTLVDQNIEYEKKSEEDIIKKFTELLIKDFRKSIQAIRESWNEGMGVVCLSELPDIIQMWAHYTDNHKGIVIGLDENQFVKGAEELVKVCYRDEMVLLPVTGIPGKLDEYHKYFDDVIRRKESNWRYEKEARLYSGLQEKDVDGNYYFDIPTASITEIYLGLRSNETTEIIAKSIKQRKEYYHLKIYKMDRHESAFKLVPIEL